MSGFLYFVPDTLRVEDWIAGRSQVFGDGPSFARRAVEKGPDEKSGTVLSPAGAHAAACGYWPDRQEWRKAPAAAAWWIGYERSSPPTPEDLLKPTALDGWPTKLNDGREWLVPVARNAIQQNVLPQTMELDDDGKFVLRPISTFAEFSAAAEQIWAEIMRAIEGKPAELTDEQEWEWAALALRFNYRLGREEISALRLFTNKNVGLVCHNICDYPSLLRIARAMAADAEAAQKKTSDPTSDSPSTEDGQKASPPITAPPTPISISMPGGGDR